jgi:hypothetical protein
VLLATIAVVIAMMLPAAAAREQAIADSASGRLLATVGRQAAWLSLAAPRRQILTSLSQPAYVTDVADTSTAPFAVVSISSPFGPQGAAGNDLDRLDTSSGALKPLLNRVSGQESFVAPVWRADGSDLLVERDDLTSPLPTYPGESIQRYASRIDAVTPDGSVTSGLLPSGRMPSASPDGTEVAVVESTDEGTALALASLTDGTTNQLVAPGQFADIAYPRFSPTGNQIAFLVPEAFVGQSTRTGATCTLWLFGPCVALAHGLAWNLWIVGLDGTNAHELGQVEADDGSLAWSPDGDSVLVYGGGGAFLVTAGTGDTQVLPYLSGYGSVAWLPE